MLSNSQIKYIRSLHQKKYRQQHGVYLLEGEKIIDELLSSSANIVQIFGTDEWILENDNGHADKVTAITPRELNQISTLRTPNQVVATVEIPTFKLPSTWKKDDLYLALEDIRDPGNLGTIIRTADWFGIKHIFCSPDCVEVFNPKVVQATMGSILRVEVHSVDLQKLLPQSGLPVYAATLEGEKIYSKQIEGGFLLVGNESKGVSETLMKAVEHQISIPKYGKAESLNAAQATGILLAEMRRQLSSSS